MEFVDLKKGAAEVRAQCEALDVERHRLTVAVQTSQAALTAAQDAGDVDAIHSAAEQLARDERRLKPIVDAMNRATGTLHAIQSQIEAHEIEAQWRAYFGSVATITKRATAEREEFDAEFGLLCRNINSSLERLSAIRDQQAATRTEFENTVLQACPKLNSYQRTVMNNADEARRQEIDALADWFRAQLEQIGVLPDDLAAACISHEPNTPSRVPGLISFGLPQLPSPRMAFSGVVEELLSSQRAEIARQQQQEAAGRHAAQQIAEQQQRDAWMRANSEEHENARRVAEQVAHDKQLMSEGKLAFVGGMRLEESPVPTTDNLLGVGMNGLEAPTRPW